MHRNFRSQNGAWSNQIGDLSNRNKDLTKQDRDGHNQNVGFVGNINEKLLVLTGTFCCSFLELKPMKHMIGRSFRGLHQQNTSEASRGVDHNNDGFRQTTWSFITDWCFQYFDILH